jgi:hypothetical protein
MRQNAYLVITKKIQARDMLDEIDRLDGDDDDEDSMGWLND